MRPVFLGCGREQRNLLSCPDKTKQSWECKTISSNQIWKLINLPQITSVLLGMLCCMAQVQSNPMDFTIYFMMSQSGGSALKAELPQLRDHQIYFSFKKESFYLPQWGEIQSNPSLNLLCIILVFLLAALFYISFQEAPVLQDAHLLRLVKVCSQQWTCPIPARRRETWQTSNGDTLNFAGMRWNHLPRQQGRIGKWALCSLNIIPWGE